MPGRETSGALDALRAARTGLSPIGARAWKDAVAMPSFRSLLGLRRATIIPLMVASLTFFFGTTIFYGYGLILATYLACWVVVLFYFVIATTGSVPARTRLWRRSSARQRRSIDDAHYDEVLVRMHTGVRPAPAIHSASIEVQP